MRMQSKYQKFCSASRRTGSQLQDAQRDGRSQRVLSGSGDCYRDTAYDAPFGIIFGVAGGVICWVAIAIVVLHILDKL